MLESGASFVGWTSGEGDNMTAAGVLDFTYQYPFASTVEETDTGAALHLATCGAHHEHPHFFDGRLYDPRVIADMLLVLA